MSEYLNTCAVPDSVIDDVWNKNKPVHGVIRSGVATMENQKNVIPQMWLSTLCISSWIDAGMHHIFHGIVSTIMNELESFMTDHKKCKAFERLANPYLEEIKEL